jgi:hypothetical protein
MKNFSPPPAPLGGLGGGGGGKKTSLQTTHSLQTRVYFLLLSTPTLRTLPTVSTFFNKQILKNHHSTLAHTSSLTRAFSTGHDNSNKFKPAVVYTNADVQKMKIIQENKGRCGIYR